MRGWLLGVLVYLDKIPNFSIFVTETKKELVRTAEGKGLEYLNSYIRSSKFHRGFASRQHRDSGHLILTFSYY